MKKNRFTQVGLDRLVRLSWLERVASLVLAGNKPDDIKAILQEDLKGSFRSSRTDIRGSIDKTITILMKVWLHVPKDLEPLRVEGLKLVEHLPRGDRLVIHWGMVMAVYPFWSGVATQVGRLLRLQGSAAATQVQRRVREQYGERETVARRARYVLRSFIDWGVLKENNAKGIYSAPPSHPIEDPKLTAWLIEAFLCSREGGSFPLKDLVESPALFPFHLKPIHPESLVASSPRLDILRHGLDDDLAMLKEPLYL